MSKLTPGLRYRVMIDLVDGEQGYLVNAYSRLGLAEHLVGILKGWSGVVDRCWVEDTLKSN